MKKAGFVMALVICIILLYNVQADPGDLIDSFDPPGNWPVNEITFDGQYFWDTGWASLIHQFSRDQIISNFTTGGDVRGVAYDGKYIWIGREYSTPETHGFLILKYNITTGKMLLYFELPSIFVSTLAYSDSYLWGIARSKEVYRVSIDPINIGSYKFLYNAPGLGPTGIELYENTIFISDPGQDLIFQLNKANGDVIGFYNAPSSNARGLAYDGNLLWIADGTMYGIDILVEEPELPGDVNNDCKVDIFDLAAVGLAYGSVPGDSNWNPNADLNNDGKINIFDLATVGLNYGKTC